MGKPGTSSKKQGKDDGALRPNTLLKYNQYLDRVKQSAKENGRELPHKDDLQKVADEFYVSITTLKTAMRVMGLEWEAGTPGVRIGTASPLRHSVWFDAVCAAFRGEDMLEIGRRAGTADIPFDPEDPTHVEQVTDEVKLSIERTILTEGKAVHAQMVKHKLFEAAIEMVVRKLPVETVTQIGSIKPLQHDRKQQLRACDWDAFAVWFPIVADAMRGLPMKDIGEKHGLTKQQISNIRKASFKTGMWEAAQDYAVRALEKTAI